tara:strand:- start:536 stop:856 length:321 start_codon:yes stop_codon:yes gene_type:complete
MRISILVLLVVNIILICFGLNELNTIKSQLKPLKVFFRLYSEQSDDIKKKISEIKQNKTAKNLSDQEMTEKLLTQFQLEKKKEEEKKNKIKIERENLKDFIEKLEN